MSNPEQDPAKQKLPRHMEEVEIDEAIDSFQNRWRYAVFPAMIAFAILAIFGFYLIFGMLQRMEDLSRDVNRLANTISQSLPTMQQDVSAMSSDMHQLNGVIGESFPKLEQQVESMSHSTETMAQTTNSMDNSIWEMNRNVSKPFSFMNKMIPWSPNNNNARYRANRPYPKPVPQYQYPVGYQQPF